MSEIEESRLDLAILRLERAFYTRRQHDGRKANAIRELGLSETTYYQRLNAMLGDPSAWRQDFQVMDAVARRVDREKRQGVLPR